MNEKNRKKKAQPRTGASQNDSMYATLSVLSQEQDPHGDCPDPEDLAAFTDGRLRGSARESLMAHLNDCVTCRHHWLMVKTAMEETPAAQSNWAAKLLKRARNTKPIRIWAGSGLGLALTACLLLVFLLPGQNDLHQMMSASYGALPPGAAERYNAFTGRGADEESNQSRFMQAYSAGKNDGRDRIRMETSAPTSKTYSDEFQTALYTLGQWVVLLQCACVAPTPAPETFWHDQASIALKMEEQLQTASQSSAQAGRLLLFMTHLQSAIQEILAGGGSAIGCEEIAAAIESIESLLQQ